LVFDASRVGSFDRVTAPPYDMVDERTRLRLEGASPYNVVRLDLGEDGAANGAASRYARSAELLAAWRRDGVLRRVEDPSLFPYEMRFTLAGRERRIRGLVALVGLDGWGTDIVPHERTMAAPVEDRLRLLRAIRANISPVYAVFRGPDDALAGRLAEAVEDGPPLVAARDEDGVEHRLWVSASLPSPQGGPLLIADGHHRTATALRYREEMRAKAGRGPWDSLMMLLVDASSERPPVLPIHRVVVRGDVPQLGEAARDLTSLLEAVDDEAMTCGVAARRGEEVTYRIVRLEGEPPVVRAAQASLLVRASELRYTHDAVEADAQVRRGEAAAAILLPATSAARIQQVIERGERLPEKSTFFWPKPRTGMVLRAFDDETDPPSATAGGSSSSPAPAS